MRWNPYIAILLGILLVFTPHFVGHLHIGDPIYRYETVEVTPTADGFEFRGDYPGGGLDDDIACIGYVERACPLERQLLTNQNISTKYGVDKQSTNYNYLLFNGTFYRITYDERGSRTYLGLDPVSSDRAFRRSATSVEYTPQPIQQAVESGSATAREALLEENGYRNELVRDAGTYYAVSQNVVRYSTIAEHRGEQIETVSSIVGPVVGLGLIFWGSQNSPE